MSNNDFTKTYQDGDPLLEDDLDSAYESLSPALANLDLATTGSNSGDILSSTGSGAAPSWISPDAVLVSATSVGANAVFADVTSVSTTVANLVFNSISSVNASIANLVAQNISSVTSTLANLVDASRTRSVASLVGIGGVAIAGSTGAITSTSASYVAVSSISIQTSGRPVRLTLIPDGTSNQAYIGAGCSSTSVATGNFRIMRNNTILVGVFQLRSVATIFGSGASILVPPGCIEFIDSVSSGSYGYQLEIQVGQSNDSSSVVIGYSKLVAYEL